MKFFTKDWHTGLLSDEEAELVEGRYRKHIDDIRLSLPKTALEFLENCSLHDGLLRYFRLQKSKQKVEIGLLCGDKISGYFNLTLTYRGVVFEDSFFNTINDVAEIIDSEILSDEWDLRDELIIHRILFSHWHEIFIVFEDLDFRMKKVEARRLLRATKVVEELP